MSLEAPIDPKDKKAIEDRKALTRAILRGWEQADSASKKASMAPESPAKEGTDEEDLDALLDRAFETTEQQTKRKLQERARELKPETDKLLGQWDQSKPVAEILKPTEEELSIDTPTKEAAMKLNVRSAAPDEWSNAEKTIEHTLETPEQREAREKKERTERERIIKEEQMKLERLENTFGERLFSTLIRFEHAPPVQGYDRMTKQGKYAYAAETVCMEIAQDVRAAFPEKDTGSVIMNTYVSILKQLGDLPENMESMTKSLEAFITKNKLHDEKVKSADISLKEVQAQFAAEDVADAKEKTGISDRAKRAVAAPKKPLTPDEDNHVEIVIED